MRNRLLNTTFLDVLTVSLFLIMGFGGILLNIVTGGITHAAILIMVLSVPAVAIGTLSAHIKEKNQMGAK